MKNERGMILVVTLAILAILTALVVEFSYGVYTAQTALNNWKESQKLSLVANSAISLAVKTISDKAGTYSFTYITNVDIPAINILSDFQGKSYIRVEDENSKFNINSIVLPNGRINQEAFKSFKRLLDYLRLDKDIADKIADWIDRDNEPRITGGEDGAKNAYLNSVDELLLIKGLEKKTYERLSPFLTVYGIGKIESELVNINTIDIPVLVSLSDDITSEMAQRVVSHRSLTPFENITDIVKVAGFEGPAGQSVMGRITVKSTNFRLISFAEENKIKRVIESVVEVTEGSQIIRFWRER